jgi:hypothetical protein
MKGASDLVTAQHLLTGFMCRSSVKKVGLHAPIGFAAAFNGQHGPGLLDIKRSGDVGVSSLCFKLCTITCGIAELLTAVLTTLLTTLLIRLLSWLQNST